MEDFNLRYPIGEFEFKEEIEKARIQENSAFFQHFPTQLNELLLTIPETAYTSVYRKGSWNIRQVVHHVADSHMNALCRFKLALTEENPTIKPYLEARWAELPDNKLPVEVSLQLIKALHERWTVILKNTTPAELNRTFYHPEMDVNLPLKRMLGLYAWHGKHHTAHITALCKRMNW